MNSTTQLPINSTSSIPGTSTVGGEGFQSTDYSTGGSGINIIFLALSKYKEINSGAADYCEECDCSHFRTNCIIDEKIN